MSHLLAHTQERRRPMFVEYFRTADSIDTQHGEEISTYMNYNSGFQKNFGASAVKKT